MAIPEANGNGVASANGTTSANGAASANGHANGTNGHTNGHSNGHSNGTNGHSNGTNGHTNGHTNGESHDTYEPIAIIGMGMRLPGGVRSAESYWDLLVNGRDGRCEVPKNRYNIDTWFGPGRVTHVGTKYAHFLEDLNYANIDASFWSFTKQEAELLDPQQVCPFD
jgi:hypothetical protein